MWLILTLSPLFNSGTVELWPPLKLTERSVFFYQFSSFFWIISNLPTDEYFLSYMFPCWVKLTGNIVAVEKDAEKNRTKRCQSKRTLLFWHLRIGTCLDCTHLSPAWRRTPPPVVWAVLIDMMVASQLQQQKSLPSRSFQFFGHFVMSKNTTGWIISWMTSHTRPKKEAKEKHWNTTWQRWQKITGFYFVLPSLYPFIYVLFSFCITITAPDLTKFNGNARNISVYFL